MTEKLDFMTGRFCESTDQLPVEASSAKIKRAALVLAVAAFSLGAVGLGVPAPRTLANVTVEQQ